MKLSSITAETEDVTVKFQSGDLQVSYRPHVFTADAVDQMQKASDDPSKQTDQMFELVRNTLARWDLEGDDGEVIPLDNIPRLRAEVPMQVFGKIWLAIQESQNPKATPRRS